ncbi:MAG TPA: RIO1 family regulatory kinase/ATPase [Methanomassiliicoccales archaeon]|nr:RIO1 family regulatory kinase/ATPase [Methanomassiliicoccales archaeon]
MFRSLETLLSELLGREIELTACSGLTATAVFLKESRLPSKKNVVYKLSTQNEHLVLKIFQSDLAEKEHSILLSCRSRGIKVPEPYLLGDDFILMEFLDGPNLCDLLNESPDFEYAEMMADWFQAFHHAFRNGKLTMVKSDAKLHNFLLTRKGLAGLDFELAHEGDPLEDIGEMCAHILDTDPMFTHRKFELCEHLLRRYSEKAGNTLSGITKWVVVALEEAASFRPSQRKELEKWVAGLDRGTVAPFCDLDPQNR